MKWPVIFLLTMSMPVAHSATVTASNGAYGDVTVTNSATPGGYTLLIDPPMGPLSLSQFLLDLPNDYSLTGAFGLDVDKVSSCTSTMAGLCGTKTENDRNGLFLIQVSSDEPFGATGGVSLLLHTDEDWTPSVFSSRHDILSLNLATSAIGMTGMTGLFEDFHSSASVVPIPGALLLFASAFLSLAAFREQNRRSRFRGISALARPMAAA